MTPTAVEFRSENGKLLATLIRLGGFTLPGVTFFSDPKDYIQVGLLNHPPGTLIPSHTHHPIERKTIGTSEILIVLSGRISVSVCGEGWEYQRFEVVTGEVVILQPDSVHGLEILEPSRILECKSGPYYGRNADKVVS